MIWTIPLLQEHLEHWCDRRPGANTIRRELHRLRYVWKRSRHVLNPDPEREKKTPEPPTRAGPRGAHAPLAEDETDLLLFLPAAGRLVVAGPAGGGPAVRPECPAVVFGGLNLRTGHLLLLDRTHQRAGNFQAFLRLVRTHYRGWHAVLLLDEDPGHTAAGSQRLAGELGVRLVWLPKRCPELNPVDHLWGHAKGAMCGNRQDATIELLGERFTGYVNGLSRWESLTKAGILSEDFWLRV